MKLSDIKGEKAIEVLGDIIDPIASIASDVEIKKMVSAGAPKLAMIRHALKYHANDVIIILATLNLQEVEEYKKHINLLTLPLDINEMLNDPDIDMLFQSQSQTTQTSFGSAMENTEAQEN